MSTWILAAAAGTAWLVFAGFSPRRALWLVLLWVPVQGWFQLNLFNDSAWTVLLYEFLLLTIYVVFLVRVIRFPKSYRPPRVMLAALPFAVWCLLLVPSSVDRHGLVLTMIGLRTYIFPLPLVWLGYYAFTNRDELEGFGSALLLQAAVVGVVAALQFANLVTPWGAVVDVPVGYNNAGTLRPPGTFSSPGHLGMYVLAMIPMAIGFLGVDSRWWRSFFYKLGLAGAGLALVVNSQRATIVLLSGSVPLIALLSKRAKGVKVVAFALGVVILGGALGLWVVRDAFEDRVRSIADDADYTLRVAPVERMSAALQEPVFGGGLGAAVPGTTRLDLSMINAAESFGAAVVFQVGVPGLLLFCVFIAALLFEGYRALVRCRRYDTGLLAAAIFVYEVAIVLDSWSYDPLHYPPSRVLFWFWAGVLLSLSKVTLLKERSSSAPAIVRLPNFGVRLSNATAVTTVRGAVR
jgi:hypothetical protein